MKKRLILAFLATLVLGCESRAFGEFAKDFKQIVESPVERYAIERMKREDAKTIENTLQYLAKLDSGILSIEECCSLLINIKLFQSECFAFGTYGTVNPEYQTVYEFTKVVLANLERYYARKQYEARNTNRGEFQSAEWMAE